MPSLARAALPFVSAALGSVFGLLVLVPLLAPRPSEALGSPPGRAPAPVADGPAQLNVEDVQEQFANPNAWSWLLNTTWMVPDAGLPAYTLSTQAATLQRISDQTVYHISDFRYGYFWGMAAARLSNAGGATNCNTLVGSVTPEGTVLLTFIPVNVTPVSAALTVQGFGRMRFKLGQWTMENQMSSNPATLNPIFHWAYMVQVTPTMREWTSLPGVGMPVPDMLAQCPPPPRLTVP